MLELLVGSAGHRLHCSSHFQKRSPVPGPIGVIDWLHLTDSYKELIYVLRRHVNQSDLA